MRMEQKRRPLGSFIQPAEYAAAVETFRLSCTRGTETFTDDGLLKFVAHLLALVEQRIPALSYSGEISTVAPEAIIAAAGIAAAGETAC